MGKPARDRPEHATQFDFRVIPLPGLALLCWLLAVRHTSLEWTQNEQYHFGWVVPLLALYLLWARLESAPTPSAAPRFWPFAACLVFLSLTEALIMPVREANADWRLFGGLLTGLAALATFLALGQAGGKQWMAHFAFPALFCFAATPWPCGWEVNLMQWLMRQNASMATELLHWLGVRAEVQGNLIRLASATLGVDEACSGIRSLQGSLMASLFVGEMFDLGRGRRVILLLAGVGWALITNVGRTVFLALMADRGGAELLERWHDPAGYWALAACVAGVVIVGWALRSEQPGWKSAPGGGATNLENVQARLSARWGPATAAILLILGGWAGTEEWFRIHEAGAIRLVDWEFNEPTQAAHFQSVEQPSRVQGDLRYNYQQGGQWQDAEGRKWAANFFRWRPGPRVLRTLVVHDPRVCLGAVGKELVKTLAPVSFRAGEIVLPFDAYWFRDGGENVFVFNCVAEDARGWPGQEQLGALLTTRSRLEAVWAGKRNLGQRRLEVAVWGMPDAEAARMAFEDLLRQQIAVHSATIGAR